MASQQLAVASRSWPRPAAGQPRRSLVCDRLFDGSSLKNLWFPTILPEVSRKPNTRPTLYRGASSPPRSSGRFLHGSFRCFGGPRKRHLISILAVFLLRNAGFYSGGARQPLFFVYEPNLRLLVWGHHRWVPWAPWATPVGLGPATVHGPFLRHFRLFFAHFHCALHLDRPSHFHA